MTEIILTLQKFLDSLDEVAIEEAEIEILLPDKLNKQLWLEINKSRLPTINEGKEQYFMFEKLEMSSGKIKAVVRERKNEPV